jgi:demethylmenaquinone methyltransferase/2-methoxy-6-polyprenyl-1,4-benzoquinol methylase
MNTVKPGNSPPEDASDVERRVVGAAPAGARDESSAAVAVREMFSSIAPRYDFLNHALSMNIDRLWWNRTARIFDPVLSRSRVRALDLCCGTGDMTFALHRRMKSASEGLIGADFSHPMLVRAMDKTGDRHIRWIEADALHLPFTDSQFDLVTAAFGFRNLVNYDRGLAEIYRVLAAGGEIGILDFGEPQGLIGAVYRLYFRHVLPKIGTLISGVRGPYAYLPRSVQRFPAPDEMLQRMRDAGFREVSWTPYTFGIAGLYRGKK